MNFGEILGEWENYRRGDKAHAARQALKDHLDKEGTVDKDAEMDRRAKVNPEEIRQLQSMRVQARLDLHGCTVAEARRLLGIFLDDCCRQGLRKVLIIHGKGFHSQGEPVLKKAVYELLEGDPRCGLRRVANREDGGSGATWVILRR